MAKAGGAWTCRGCGRVVPGPVASCRCGVSRPAVWSADGADIGDARSRLISIATTAVVLGAAGAGVYFWYQTWSHRPAAPPPVARAAVPGKGLTRPIAPPKGTSEMAAPAA